MRNDNRLKKIFLLAFTVRGKTLADSLAKRIGGEVSLSREAGGVRQWTEQNFYHADALIYIGAVGIAVRAIAPFLKSKVSDPAVIVIDEGGSFIIPILSGHLGGANDLARELAVLTGGTAVITTATDVSKRFAVDEWAKKQGCSIKNPKRIVQVSSKVLAGEDITVQSDWPVTGEPPEFVRQMGAGLKNEHMMWSGGKIADEGRSMRSDSNQEKAGETDPETICSMPPDVRMTIRRQNPHVLANCLQVIPHIAVLGIGCRKGTEAAFLDACFHRFLEEYQIEETAVCAAASIDLKKEEQGLLEFCKRHEWPVSFYTAEQLLAEEGDFTESDFVRKITGVDNVCERSAVCAAEGGELLVRKTKFEGITMALAVRNFYPTWK